MPIMDDRGGRMRWSWYGEVDMFFFFYGVLFSSSFNFFSPYLWQDGWTVEGEIGRAEEDDV